MGISNIDSVNHECITQQINMVQALHSHLTPESISQQQCLHAWLRHEDRDPGSDWDDGDRIDSEQQRSHARRKRLRGLAQLHQQHQILRGRHGALHSIRHHERYGSQKQLVRRLAQG